MDGIDEEITLLRVKIKTLVGDDPKNLRLLVEATNALERLRAKAETISIAGSGGVTISCGLAQWSPQCGYSLKDVFNQADMALYEAKRTGRNRLVVNRACGHTA